MSDNIDPSLYERGENLCWKKWKENMIFYYVLLFVYSDHYQKWRTETEKHILVHKCSDSYTVEHTGSPHFAPKISWKILPPPLSLQFFYAHDINPIW